MFGRQRCSILGNPRAREVMVREGEEGSEHRMQISNKAHLRSHHLYPSSLSSWIECVDWVLKKLWFQANARLWPPKASSRRERREQSGVDGMGWKERERENSRLRFKPKQALKLTSPCGRWLYQIWEESSGEIIRVASPMEDPILNFSLISFSSSQSFKNYGTGKSSLKESVLQVCFLFDLLRIYCLIEQSKEESCYWFTLGSISKDGGTKRRTKKGHRISLSIPLHLVFQPGGSHNWYSGWDLME